MGDIPQTTLDLVAGVLNLGSDRISAATTIVNEPAWDSLAHMRLILAIEEKLGRELEPETLVEIMSVEDIARILDQ